MDKFEDVDLNATSNSKRIPILQKYSTTADSTSNFSSNNNNTDKITICTFYYELKYLRKIKLYFYFC